MSDLSRAVDAVVRVNADYDGLTEAERAQRRMFAEPFAQAMLNAGFRTPTDQDLADAIAASPDGTAALQSNWLRQLLVEAFNSGGIAMADQISEDHFGGEASFTAQYVNPFELTGGDEDLTLLAAIRWYLGYNTTPDGDFNA